jgi:hypothetical protein
MKLSELTVGTEYAVVPSWTYSNRSARDEIGRAHV